jgi:hypothetical protein
MTEVVEVIHESEGEQEKNGLGGIKKKNCANCSEY